MLRKIWDLLPARLKKPVYVIKGSLGRGKVVYQTKTTYSHLQVIDKKGSRYLVFLDPAQPLYLQQPEAVYQSCMTLDKSRRTNAPYADYFHLALIFNPRPKTVLMIGLGGGTVASSFLHEYEDIKFTTVEIDQEVVNVAYRYFALPRDPRHQVIIDDGRRHVQSSAELVDLILLDAFFSRTIPHHLFTAEFFQEARARLTARGLLAVNLNGALTGPDSRLFRSVYRTITTAFPRIYIFAGKKDLPRQIQNIALFALPEDLALTPEDMYNRAGGLWRNKVAGPGLAQKVGKLYDDPVDLAGVPVLSDASPPPGGQLSIYRE